MRRQGPCSGSHLPVRVPPVSFPHVPNSVFGALSSPLINRTFGTFICLAAFFFFCLRLSFTGSFFFFLKVQFICFRDAGSGKATKDSGSPLPYFIIYDTSGSPRLSSSDWDLYSQLPTPEGLTLQSKRSEKRERKSISLPLGLSDLVLDAGGSSSFVSSVGSCGACHFTRVCHRIADSWGSLCLSVSLLDAQCSESLSPSHQRELSLEARAPACLW